MLEKLFEDTTNHIDRRLLILPLVVAVDVSHWYILLVKRALAIFYRV